MFTCMSCREVRIEITNSFDTDSFILALRRLISRRENVQTIFSDNGSNFIGSGNELRRALEEMDKEKLQSFMQTSSGDWVNWKWDPPYASNMGNTLLISDPFSPLLTVFSDANTLKIAC